MPKLTAELEQTLFDTFDAQIFAVSVLAWDGWAETCKGLPDSMLGETTIFSFRFTQVNESAKDVFMLIGHARSAFHVDYGCNERNCLMEIAESISPDGFMPEDDRPTTFLEITDFLLPIDSVSGMQLRTKKVSIVRDLGDEPIGLFFGSNMA